MVELEPKASQHINLAHRLTPQEFVSTLRDVVCVSNFLILEVQFKRSLQSDQSGRLQVVSAPIGFKKAQDFGTKDEGVFILAHPEKGNYLVQFESAFNDKVQVNQALIRRISDFLSPQILIEASQNLPESFLYFQHKKLNLVDTPQVESLQTNSVIQLSGSDQFLQELVLALQHTI